jgi:hypothetical protein
MNSNEDSTFIVNENFNHIDLPDPCSHGNTVNTSVGQYVPGTSVPDASSASSESRNLIGCSPNCVGGKASLAANSNLCTVTDRGTDGLKRARPGRRCLGRRRGAGSTRILEFKRNGSIGRHRSGSRILFPNENSARAVQVCVYCIYIRIYINCISDLARAVHV